MDPLIFARALSNGGVVLPNKVAFNDQADLEEWLKKNKADGRLSPGFALTKKFKTKKDGIQDVKLQTNAMKALNKAQSDLGKPLLLKDKDSAARNYKDTVYNWNDRVLSGLKAYRNDKLFLKRFAHGIDAAEGKTRHGNGSVARDTDWREGLEAYKKEGKNYDVLKQGQYGRLIDRFMALPQKDQTGIILDLEKSQNGKRYWFSTRQNKRSIIRSAAPPGTSHHNAMPCYRYTTMAKSQGKGGIKQ